MTGWVYRLGFIGLAIAGLTLFHSARQNREPRIVTAARQKILLAGNGTEIETLDPDLATGVPEHKVISAIFEGLITPGDDDPEADAFGAAESMTHEAFTHWTFKLRPQARWSDGVPVTAGDFVFAYQRILSPEFAADYGPMLYPLKNAEAFHKGELKDFSQVGVVARDDHTLELHLTGPVPYLPGMMKHYTWFPVPRHIVLKHGSMTDRLNPWTKPQNIVTNGPFKVKEWRFTHFLSVERNPHYWDAAAVRLNEIHFFPIASDTTEERSFQDRQLHLTDTVPLTRIPYYRAKEASVYHADPSFGTQFLRVNVTRGPLKDVRVRQALSLALDRQSIVDNVMRAGQTPCYGLTPPGCVKGYETPHLIKGDVAEAQRLLAEAGYPEGKGFPNLEVLITQSSAARVFAEAMQEMMNRNLGIKIGLLNQEWQVYLDAMRKLEYDIALAAWLGDYPDPNTFLNIWRTNDGNNNTGFSNATFDDAISRAATTPDVTQRFQILHEAEKLLLTELPIIPLYWRVESSLMSPQVKNFRASMLEHRAYKVLDVE